MIYSAVVNYQTENRKKKSPNLINGFLKMFNLLNPSSPKSKNHLEKSDSTESKSQKNCEMAKNKNSQGGTKSFTNKPKDKLAKILKNDQKSHCCLVVLTAEFNWLNCITLM